MKSKILNMTLLSLLTLIPSVKNITYTNYMFALTFMIILIILIIFVTNINVKIKILTISILLFTYRNNLLLFNFYFDLLFVNGYINTTNDRIDNKILTKKCHNIFNQIFNLKLNFSKLTDKPSLIVCNYCTDRFENPAIILIPKNIVVLARDIVLKYSKLNKLLKWVIVIKKENSYENTKKEIMKHVNEGRSVVSYITKDPYLGPLDIRGIRSGIFKIAKELDIPVTPIAIDYIDNTYGSIKYQNFHIEAASSFKVDNIKDSMYETKKFYKESMIKFKKNKYFQI